MTKSVLETTNFVVCSCASSVEDGMYLEQVWLLGWDNDTDWYTSDIDAQDIMTPSGKVKQCKYGSMIAVSRHETAYVGHTIENCKSACDGGIKEGYDCCILRLETDSEGDVKVYKV